MQTAIALECSLHQARSSILVEFNDLHVINDLGWLSIKHLLRADLGSLLDDVGLFEAEVLHHFIAGAGETKGFHADLSVGVLSRVHRVNMRSAPSRPRHPLPSPSQWKQTLQRS